MPPSKHSRALWWVFSINQKSFREHIYNSHCMKYSIWTIINLYSIWSNLEHTGFHVYMFMTLPIRGDGQVDASWAICWIFLTH